MRSYCAVYVDVGYLLASAATRVTGTSLRRGVAVDYPALVAGLIRQAEADSGLPLLRVNWYDSGGRTGGVADWQQQEIGLMPKVKLRLGRLSQTGEQKGVDVRIGLDLATHGRNGVADVMYLVSGDDDLTEAVAEAQGHGVQVMLLAVPSQHGPRAHSVSVHLQREADGLILIDPELIERTVVPMQGPTPETEAAVAADTTPAELSAPNGASAAPPAGPAGEVGAAAVAAGSSRPDRPAAGRSDAATHEEGHDHGAAVTPALLGAKRASVLIPPSKPAAHERMRALGAPLTPFQGQRAPIEVVDAVSRQVVDSWCQSATPESLRALKDNRPYIPSDLDRTLLVDLSSRSGIDDIDDISRHALRERFWRIIDQVKLG